MEYHVFFLAVIVGYGPMINLLISDSYLNILSPTSYTSSLLYKGTRVSLVLSLI